MVEYSFTGNDYVVQKNKIKEVANIITLGDEKTELLKIINQLKPSVIHILEHPELFMDFDLAKQIYQLKDINIVESTHTSTYDTKLKNFLPDKFILPCEFSSRSLFSYEIDTDVVEYTHTPIPITKEGAQKTLGFDNNKKNVINVGLFTPGKNQAEVIQLARELPEINFHFIGNQAQNFEFYWKPLMENLPKNCFIWGERNDVDLFYAAADLMYFPSKNELNPLCIKEALAYKLPVLAYNLDPYLNKYDGLITYIKSGEQKKQILTLTKINKSYKIKLVHLLSIPNSEKERKSIRHIAPMAQFEIDYIQHVNPPTKILPEELKQKDRPNLTAGHLGCFLAFLTAIETELTDDYDFLLICEGDCKLEVSHKEFYDAIQKACVEISQNNLSIFSFGDTRDLEKGVLQSEYLGGYNSDFAFQASKIIGLQSVLIPKNEKTYILQQYEKEPWHGMDIWFNIIFSKDDKKIGIVKKRLTTQFNGPSLIDGYNKNFK